MISVLVPVYNSSKYLKKCLESILKQSFKDFELIIVDDGSTDGSDEIIRSFAKKDKRIVYLTKENEKSISKTRNYLLDKIQGEYFVFVDSDDIVDKRFLQMMYQTMKSNESDIVSCSFKIVDVRDATKKPMSVKSYNGHEALIQMMFNGKFYSLWNKLIKTSLVENVRFNESLNYGEDIVFFFDLLKKKVKFTFINNQLYFYRIRPNSLSTSAFGDSKKYFLEHLIEISKDERYSELREIVLVWIYCTARYFRYMTSSAKRANKEYRRYLKQVIKEYKPHYKRSKIVNNTYKMVVNFFSLF